MSVHIPLKALLTAKGLLATVCTHSGCVMSSQLSNEVPALSNIPTVAVTSQTQTHPGFFLNAKWMTVSFISWIC